MFTVRIMNEFLHGPVWVLDEEGISVASGTLPLVEDDAIVQEINKEAGSLFDSYYEFDSHGESCWFNEDMQRVDASLKSTTARTSSRTSRRPSFLACSQRLT